MFRSKNSKILAACLAVLLVSSIGYALFSQTLNVTGSAKAQGDFRIISSCQAGIMDDIASKVSYNSADENHYDSDSCTRDLDTQDLTFQVNFTQPGAVRYFTVKFTNNGGTTAGLSLDEGIVPTKFDICFDGNSQSNEKNGTIENSECSDALGIDANPLTMFYLSLEDLVFEKENGAKYAYGEQGNDFIDENNVVVLEPNESIYMVIPTGLSQYMNLNPFLIRNELRMHFDFKQYN